MHVKITSLGEYDRHDNVVRFIARIDSHPVSFTIGEPGLFMMKEALNLKDVYPIDVYNVGGRLLTRIVELVYVEAGANPAQSHFISREDVLRVTGRIEEANSVRPQKWTN